MRKRCEWQEGEERKRKWGWLLPAGAQSGTRMGLRLSSSIAELASASARLRGRLVLSISTLRGERHRGRQGHRAAVMHLGASSAPLRRGVIVGYGGCRRRTISSCSRRRVQRPPKFACSAKQLVCTAVAHPTPLSGRKLRLRSQTTTRTGSPPCTKSGTHQSNAQLTPTTFSLLPPRSQPPNSA